MLKQRVRGLNCNATKVSPAKGKPIIYWMSRDQRVQDNWAMLYAQQCAIEAEAPVGHTRTHTYTRTHTRTHKHTHTLHSYTRGRAGALARAHTRKHVHTHNAHGALGVCAVSGDAEGLRCVCVCVRACVRVCVCVCSIGAEL